MADRSFVDISEDEYIHILSTHSTREAEEGQEYQKASFQTS